MRVLFIFLFNITTAINAFAITKWSHESEVSVVTIRGNANSDTASMKQSTKYSQEKNSLTLSAAYTKVDTNQTTTAKSSNIGLRYDHFINVRTSGFLSHEVYSDKFAGYTQEDRSTLGLSYQVLKKESQSWSFELGYVHSYFNYVGPTNESVNSLQVSTDYLKNINKNVTTGVKVKYRNAFSDAKDTNIPLYWLDSEWNLTVVMSEVFSLKLAYENKYQNYALKAPLQKTTDTKFTTALVAKF